MAQVRNFITAENLDLGTFLLDQTSKTIKLQPALLREAGATGVTNFTFNDSAKKLTWSENGVAKEKDLSAFLTDVHVTGQTLVAGVLTLSQANGPDVTIDLNTLAKPVFQNSATAHVAGAGTEDDPFIVTAQYEADTNSGISVVGNKVSLNKAEFVELQDAFGNPIGDIFVGAAPPISVLG